MGYGREAWQQVGESFEAIGEHVKEHFEEPVERAASERRAFETAVRSLLDVIEDGLQSVGQTVRDPRLREDAVKAADSMREAFAATFDEIGEELRSRLPGRAEQAQPVTPPAEESGGEHVPVQRARPKTPARKRAPRQAAARPQPPSKAGEV